MKRILAILMAVLMLLSCHAALAEGDENNYFVAEMGMSFTKDMETNIINKIDNTMSLSLYGVVSHEPYCDIVEISYCALAPDILDARQDEIEATSDSQKRAEIANATFSLFVDIGEIAVTQIATPEEYLTAADRNPDEILAINEVGTVDGYHWYYTTLPVDKMIARYDELKAFGEDDEQAKAGLEKARSEIEFCQAELLKYLESTEYVAPVDPDIGYIGQVIQFESTDLDGNTFSSADLFKDNEITMVNLWGTWCPNCVNEMAELARIHTNLQAKGCGIVGIEFEKKPIEEIGDTARGILAANSVNYPSVLMPGDNVLLNGVSAYPTTFFVDREGKILTYPIAGAAVDEYEGVVDKLLAGEAVNLAPETGAAANGDNKYRVFVYDADGNPVEGAVVQFCDEATCSFQTTDADGLATFPVAEQKVYEVHMLKVPEGYREDANIYKTMDTFSDVNIFLEKAE